MLDVTTIPRTDLDDRMAGAFGDGVKSDAVTVLISEVEAAAVAADEAAARARGRALDLTLSAADVTSARRAADDAAFTRDRLKAAVSRLAEREKQIRGQEQQQRRWAAYERVKAQRDRLAAELKACYPAIEAQLGKLIAEIEHNDRELEFIRAQAFPAGVEDFRSAELVARDLAGFRIFQQDVSRITRDLILPAFVHDPHNSFVWPRSRISGASAAPAPPVQSETIAAVEMPVPVEVEVEPTPAPVVAEPEPPAPARFRITRPQSRVKKRRLRQRLAKAGKRAARAAAAI